MDLISVLLLLSAAAAPLALLGGWLAGGRDRRLGLTSPVGGSDGWWRQTMPWPHGVQEDDDVQWSFGRETAGPEPTGDLSFDPIRVRPGVRLRPGGRR